MHKPRGFPLGGPRKGEVRPFSPGSAAQKLYLERMSASEREEYRAVARMYAQLKRLAFPQKCRDIAKRSRQREACWQASPRAFNLQQFMREMERCCKK